MNHKTSCLLSASQIRPGRSLTLDLTFLSEWKHLREWKPSSQLPWPSMNCGSHLVRTCFSFDQGQLALQAGMCTYPVSWHWYLTLEILLQLLMWALLCLCPGRPFLFTPPPARPSPTLLNAHNPTERPHPFSLWALSPAVTTAWSLAWHIACASAFELELKCNLLCGAVLGPTVELQALSCVSISQDAQ
jgi:hypothetical protein